MNASIAVALDSSPASSGRQPGDLGDDLADRAHRIGRRRRRSTRRSRSAGRCGRAPSPAGGGRRRRRDIAARRPARGRRRCRAAAPAAGTPCHPHQGVGHGDDDLAGERPFVLLRRAWQRSPTAWRSPRRRTPAAAALSPHSSRSARSGHLPISSSRVSIARYFDREPITTSDTRRWRVEPRGRCLRVRSPRECRCASAQRGTPAVVRPICEAVATRHRSGFPWPSRSDHLRCRAWVCSTARRSWSPACSPTPRWRSASPGWRSTRAPRSSSPAPDVASASRSARRASCGDGIDVLRARRHRPRTRRRRA